MTSNRGVGTVILDIDRDQDLNMTVALQPQRARRLYDLIGSRVDWLKFYEGEVTHRALDMGEFEHTSTVLELGCGSGRVANELFTRFLPGDAHYRGIDLSPKMVSLASRRLAEFGARAHVTQYDGEQIPDDGAPFNRFLSTFVFDLLSPEHMRSLMDQAHALMTPGARACVTSMAPPATPLARVVTWPWIALWTLSPVLTGGCRPVDIRPAFDPERWHVDAYEVITLYGVSSSILTATAR